MKTASGSTRISSFTFDARRRGVVPERRRQRARVGRAAVLEVDQRADRAQRTRGRSRPSRSSPPCGPASGESRARSRSSPRAGTRARASRRWSPSSVQLAHLVDVHRQAVAEHRDDQRRGRRRPRRRRRSSRSARTPARHRCRSCARTRPARGCPAFSISSRQIRITSGLRRVSTPATPMQKMKAERTRYQAMSMASRCLLGRSRRASTTAPTAAISSSSETTSNEIRNLVRNSSPIREGEPKPGADVGALGVDRLQARADDRDAELDASSATANTGATTRRTGFGSVSGSSSPPT